MFLRFFFIILCVCFIILGSFLHLKRSDFEQNNAAFVFKSSGFTPDTKNPQNKASVNKQIQITTKSDLSQFQFFESGSHLLVPNFEKSAHASALLDLDSKLMVVFFAGSREGARDVKIYGSFLSKGSMYWNEPKPLIDAQMLSHLSGKFIRKVGNPIVFKDSFNRVHLFVVGVSLGGWATSKIYQFRFDEVLDNIEYLGELHLGVFANFSHLVRTPALSLENGGFMLPFYYELADKYPLVGFFDKDSKLLFTKKLHNFKSQLQPSVIPLSSSDCLAVFRIHRSHDNKMFLQQCKDFGNTWEAPYKSNLQNFDSSSVLLNINGEVILVHNDGLDNPLLLLYDLFHEKVRIHPRASLSLFWLRDKSKGEFVRLMTLDALKDGEVSYPAAVSDDTNLYISYTYDRKQIKSIIVSLDSIFELIKQDRESLEEFHLESLVPDTSQTNRDSTDLDSETVTEEQKWELHKFDYLRDVG